MQPRPTFAQFRGVTPMWDNTARRQDDGMILADSTPEAFGIWMERALRQTRRRHAGDQRLLFVNAWNEWAEGNHLEPDDRHGRRYLDAARTARRVERESPVRRPSLADMDAEAREALRGGDVRLSRFGAKAPRDDDIGISVVMPLYNHAGFLARTFASLTAQTRLPDELVVVDDGSTDDGARVIEALARDAPFAVTLAVQRNAGADRALNRGIAIARGHAIAIINSDDAYAPRRLEVLCTALREGVDLAFSDVELVDDDDRPVEGEYAQRLRAWIDATGEGPEMLRALVRQNVATSTGNLVFRRALLAQTGGFAPLAICHDWDFVLAASYATRFAFVRERLYRYRLHGTNTFAGRPLAGREEGEQVVAGFLKGIGRHPWLNAAGRAEFLAFARAAGLTGYLPRELRK